MTAVWDTPTETHTQKLVLLALADNANDEGTCWPSMTTIAKKCQMSIRSVYREISQLAKINRISVESGGGRFSNRYTILPMTGCHPTPANLSGVPCQPVTPPLPMRQGTPDTVSEEPSEKRHGNTTEPMNGSAVEVPIKISPYHEHARAIIEILNKTSGHDYRDVDVNLAIITARLREPEVTIDGVRQMIDRQCKIWKGTEMDKYLRPETLFRKSKFDGYYAQRNSAIIKDNGRSGQQVVNGNTGTLNVFTADKAARYRAKACGGPAGPVQDVQRPGAGANEASCS